MCKHPPYSDVLMSNKKQTDGKPQRGGVDHTVTVHKILLSYRKDAQAASFLLVHKPQDAQKKICGHRLTGTTMMSQSYLCLLSLEGEALRADPDLAALLLINSSVRSHPCRASV